MMKRLLFRTCIVVLLVFLSSTPVRASVALNSTYFPDESFRNALAPYATNGVIDETQLTELDVSGRGITDLTGVEKLTALTKLVAANNSIQFVKLTNNPHLQWLDLSGNIALRGFRDPSSYPPSASNHYIALTVNMPLQHLDLSNCSIGYFQLLSTYWHVTSLTWLSLANDSQMDGWSSGITAQTGLVYCDLTNTGQNSSSVGFTSAHNSLETLILKDNAINAPVTCLQYMPALKYLDLSNTGQSQSSSLGLTSIHTNLETLILNRNSSFGWSSSLQYLSALKYLDISNCDLYFRGDGHLLDYLTSSNNPNLETLIANNSQMGSLSEGLTGFSNLKTVDISGNPNVTQFWVNGSPLLETLDLHGNTGLKILSLENGGYPRTNLTIDDTNCNALTGLKLNNNGYGSVATAMSNATAWGLDNIQFLYLESNSGFTGGPLTMGANDCGNLHGLDLGNNGFTSFLAESLPQSLTALMIGDNPSMERLEMHNNPGITKMTSNPTMSDGSGLYLLGNTALHYMDISGQEGAPNYFQHIGNNFSLQGVPIDTIKGCYNKFYTFRNLSVVPGGRYEVCKRSNYVYSISDTLPNPRYYYSAFWPTMAACPDSASVEQLTGLRYLDLSHCQLKDSLYLHKNTELRFLDVSHNRTIKRYTTSQDKGAGYRASIPPYNTFNREYPDYKKYLWLVDTRPKYPGRQEAYDQEYYTLDYNDTTGLYILDLMDNDKLEYLDVSYTGIEQTALTHCHVSNARYMWIQDLHNLKYLYADYNGMRSMGIGTLNGKHHQEALKSLERLSIIGMRGADVTTMQGSMNFLNNGRCPKLRYINVSYSDFDSIGFHAPQIDTIIVKGNPIHYLDVQDVDSITYIDATECAFKQRGYDPETKKTVAIPSVIKQRILWTNYNTGQTYDSIQTITMNGARSNGLYSGTVTTPFSGLRGIRAHHRPKLTTLLVNKSNALTDVYCHFDPKLIGITGFDDLAYPKDSVDAAFGFQADVDTLNLVWVNDDYALVNLNLTKNVNLKYLHAYNDKALGTALSTNGMDLSPNQNLITAWVSNSNLQRFTNYAGQRSTQEHLDTLKIWQNPELSELDVTKYNNLRYLDLRNCMVNVLDVNSNSKLTYFDCSNMDSTSTDFVTWNNYGFTMPKAVPTSLTQPGKNSIADLNFSSTSLEVVHADNNDLYRMTGLNANPNLNTLTYSYNHINAINLSGCTSLPLSNVVDYAHYDCRHNVRGVIPGELSVWNTTENGERIEHKMYYFQLEKNAGDAIQPNYNTFLGSKSGDDTLRIVNGIYQLRNLEDDGFDPTKVIRFTVNSSGPYVGSRGREGNTPSGAPSRVIVEPSEDLQLDLSTIYGTIAVIKYMDPERNYIEYLYDDGRPSSSKAAGGSGFGLGWGAPSVPTDVEEIEMDGLGEPTVVSERYYDAAGIEHSEPIKGVNIVVRQMSDGSTQTVKVLK